MQFAGINYWAILIAAIVAYIASSIWYMVLAKPWAAAHGFAEDMMTRMKAAHGGKPSPTPFIIAFIANLVMAWVLAGLLGHLGPGQVTLMNGVISAAFVWVGFVITTLAVNNSFAMRKPMLIAIDGGHWLLVLLVMGAIIGTMGVGAA
jgi:hypothetical protein